MIDLDDWEERAKGSTSDDAWYWTAAMLEAIAELRAAREVVKHADSLLEAVCERYITGPIEKDLSKALAAYEAAVTGET